jgi:hypothetical protein
MNSFDNFQVTVGIILNSGASVGQFTMIPEDAVAFATAYHERDASADSNPYNIKHSIGVAVVELDKISAITITSGTALRVKELIENLE